MNKQNKQHGLLCVVAKSRSYLINDWLCNCRSVRAAYTVCDGLSRQFWRQWPNVGALGPCAEGPRASSITGLLPEPQQINTCSHSDADPQPVALAGAPSLALHAHWVSLQRCRCFPHAGLSGGLLPGPVQGCMWPLCDLTPLTLGSDRSPMPTHTFSLVETHRLLGLTFCSQRPGNLQSCFLTLLALAGTLMCPHGGVYLSPRAACHPINTHP